MNVSEKSYGVLTYNSINIGDEIQSLAAMRFLPQIDEYVFREQISNFLPEKGKITKCIMNAWWMWCPYNFPPSQHIDPLLISMHFYPGCRKSIITPKTKAYFNEYGPVGCRDMGSLEWLKSQGVDAYFSGCLTTTLQRNYDVPREDYILCVDVPAPALAAIKQRTQRPVYELSRDISPYYDSKQRLEFARCLLALYHNAHCVVSPRLHVITPCVAMEVPVLRMLTDELTETGVDNRYAGFEKFYHTLHVKDFVANPDAYDLENPPKNPDAHLEMRNSLIERCKQFTGYDSGKSPIPSHMNIAAEMARLNHHRYDNIKRLLYFAKLPDLEKVLKIRKSHRATHQNLVNGKLVGLKNAETPKPQPQPEVTPFNVRRYILLKVLNGITFGKNAAWNKEFQQMQTIKKKRKIVL